MKCYLVLRQVSSKPRMFEPLSVVTGTGGGGEQFLSEATVIEIG